MCTKPLLCCLFWAQTFKSRRIYATLQAPHHKHLFKIWFIPLFPSSTLTPPRTGAIKLFSIKIYPTKVIPWISNWSGTSIPNPRQLFADMTIFSNYRSRIINCLIVSVIICTIVPFHIEWCIFWCFCQVHSCTCKAKLEVTVADTCLIPFLSLYC